MKKALNQQNSGKVTALLLTILFLAGTMFLASAQTSPPAIRHFSWLSGKWKNTDRNIFEHWSFNEDSTELSGVSYSIKEKDTTVLEKLRLICDATNCYYVADVPDNGRPIRFAMVQHSPNSFRSENTAHDYPKYIEYKLEGPGKLRAEVGDANRKQVFTFERKEEKD